MKYLLDTNICIYIIKKKYFEIVEKLSATGIERVSISSITIAEMEYGIAKSSTPALAEEKLYEFLAPFLILDFTASAARYYGKIRMDLHRSGTSVSEMDMMIASIAMSNDLKIVTNDEKDFRRIKGIEIENWIKG